MNERLAAQIRNYAENHPEFPVSSNFIARLDVESGLTRDENPQTHYCVYFAAYDPDAGQIFIGQHKKSGLWLFNGGHIDQRETLDEALMREIGEEWGLEITREAVGEPQLLTITEINNPTKQTCTRHYDIWYFVSVNKDTFAPDQHLLDKEFHSMKWLSPDRARKLVTDPSTFEAISLIESRLNVE
jgi:8-oxo-dGTP pyrophosphatase MutT (NUDIX family)